MKSPFQSACILFAAVASSAAPLSCSQENTPEAASENTPGGPAADAYPLTVCVVSGEPLGSMGDPYVHTHEGTTVKFCCENCLDEFNENPDQYIAKIKEAEPGS